VTKVVGRLVCRCRGPLGVTPIATRDPRLSPAARRPVRLRPSSTRVRRTLGRYLATWRRLLGKVNPVSKLQDLRELTGPRP